VIGDAVNRNDSNSLTHCFGRRADEFTMFLPAVNSTSDGHFGVWQPGFRRR